MNPLLAAGQNYQIDRNGKAYPSDEEIPLELIRGMGGEERQRRIKALQFPRESPQWIFFKREKHWYFLPEERHAEMRKIVKERWMNNSAE